MNFIEYIRKLKTVNGTNEKLSITKEFLSNENEDAMLAKIILNPFLSFGIKSASLNINRSNIKENWNAEYTRRFINVLILFARRKVTGDKARKIASEFIAMFDSETRKILLNAIDKKIGHGVNIKIFNKAIPNCIPLHKIQKGIDYNDKNKKHISFPCAVEPKFDGVRCTAIINEYMIVFLSSNGKVYELPYHKKKLSKIQALKETVLDCELKHPDGYKRTMELCRLKEPNDKELVLHVFDVMSLKEYNEKKCILAYKHMRKKLQKIGMSIKSLKVVESIIVNNQKELDDAYANFLNQGYEGVMIKNLNARYEFKRSNNWLKRKPINTMDCKIIGFKRGTGKYSDTLGALVLQQQNGKKCKLSGMNDAMRDVFWKNQNKYKGAYVECKYQELTKDGVMRFPRYYRMRYDKK